MNLSVGRDCIQDCRSSVWSKRTLTVLGVVAGFFLIMSTTAMTAHARAMLPRQPTIHGQQIVFVYGTRLWSVGVSDAQARPLTSAPGIASHPHFSPNGHWVAFSLEQNGNEAVYVMPAAGGQPRRLTWHPGSNVVVGWTPDGKSVLFRSARHSYVSVDRLFTVALTGGLPKQVPLPMAERGSYSLDGTHLAYVPFTNISPNSAFGHYHGGLQARIWIAKLSNSSIVRVPHTNSEDFDPMWIGDEIYFISDRNPQERFTLYRYDTHSRKVSEVLPATGPNIKSAATDGSRIVYETVGALHVLDLASGKSRRLKVDISGDFPHLEPHYVKVGDRIVAAGISPNGVRAVFSAHGEILTVPAQQGSIRNITDNSGADAVYPAWSPNGRWIAYFSDASGENALYLSPQDGQEPPKDIDLDHPNLYYYHPVWSPDSKKIAYTDQFGNLWYVNLSTGKPVKVTTDTYYSPRPLLGKATFYPVFSPDSRYLAYAKLMPDHMREVFIYSLKTGKSHPVANNLADERYIAWDKSGKYLYFTASTTIGPTTGWLDMSSYNRPVTRHVYVVMLRESEPSPLTLKPGNDQGLDKPGHDDRASVTPVKVKVDFKGINQRIVALPIPAKPITGLQAGQPGVLFIAVGKLLHVGTRGGPQGSSHTIYTFDLATEKTQNFLAGVTVFHVAADGKHLLYAEPSKHGDNWFITSADTPPKARHTDKLATDNLYVWVRPRVEWGAMYREAWRRMRNFFYDKNLHGLNSREAERLYWPYVKTLVSEQGLYYILNDMRGLLVNSHVSLGMHPAKPSGEPRTGLLGATYVIAHGRYQFARIFGDGNWDPGLHAPLARPGLDVHAGDYLLAVDGRKLTASDNIYRFFRGMAGQQTTLEVSPNPNGQGARTIRVVPIRSERRLRLNAWVQGNVRTVNRLSHGKIAYVYLPNTADAGYKSFNRYFFAQIDKPAVILDDRYNGGGELADYFIDYLNRYVMMYWETRHRHGFTSPEGAIFGPKAMLINEYAGSGGDALPWLFREANLGPLIGMPTWGGLNAVAGVPPLIDGTVTSVPRVAVYGPHSRHIVENIGVAPDMRVPLSPKAWRQGHDNQLKKAVSVVLKMLKGHPVKHVKPPPYKNYHQHPEVSPPVATGPSPIRDGR